MNNINFPSATIPPSPILDFGTLNFTTQSPHNSVLSIKNKRYTTSGRAAIALALEDAGITPEHEVLIPAYHCESMVAPVKWRGADVIFYKINPDTSIQVDDIKNKITPKTKAIIVTHYFGFVQHLKNIRHICNQYNIILIEDCAHALFGQSDGYAIGTTGDYAVASCMKFLPIYEGGLIASNTQNLTNIKLESPSFLFQIKSLLNPLEIAIHYHRLGLLGQLIQKLLNIKNTLWRYLKQHHQTSNTSYGPSSSDGGFGLDEAWIHKTLSLFSKFVVTHTPLNHVITQRRTNYNKLNSSLSKLPGCRPLFDKLPPHTVPWVYPLYVEQPEKYFTHLKMAGVPVWRFGEFLDPSVNATTCPISVEYSQHIFQFPCHKSLSQQDLDWLLSTITDIFKNTP
jgi:perosamine synthetase